MGYCNHQASNTLTEQLGDFLRAFLCLTVMATLFIVQKGFWLPAKLFLCIVLLTPTLGRCLDHSSLFCFLGLLTADTLPKTWCNCALQYFGHFELITKSELPPSTGPVWMLNHPCLPWQRDDDLWRWWPVAER